MNTSDVKEWLADTGVTPSRKLGQNFLVDNNICQWFVEALDIAPGETVVEVGPGTGSLSALLAEKADRLILIEYDSRLAAALAEKYEGQKHVTVHHADAARFDTRQLFADGPVKLISNLPFSAGGAIMRNFLDNPSPITMAVLMLQKEVIDRMVAEPRTKDYSVLSLRTQSFWDVRPAKTVPPEALHPRPLIDSTIAVITRRSESLPVHDERLFDSLIRRGFSQRRKQVRKQMPESPVWEEVAAELNISPTARAEELSLLDWVAVTNLYDDHPLKNIPQKGGEILDVVDENDVVIRTERRDVIHAENLVHRAVHILVFNKNKEIFLQKRSRLKDKCPGLWDSSAAGHLDAGEDYGSSALRELEEELGVKVEASDLQEIARIKPSENTGWEHIAIFLARYDGALRYPCSEVETGMWMPMEELDRWISLRSKDFAPGFIECWKNFRQLMAKM